MPLDRRLFRHEDEAHEDALIIGRHDVPVTPRSCWDLNKPAPMTRRHMLRSLGATIALPWMASLAHAVGGSVAVKAGPPRRYACVVFSNGINELDWWTKGEGASMELGPTLQPLAPFRGEFSSIKGLRLFENDRVFKVHTPYFSNFLSGHLWTPTAVPDMAQSLDCFLGQQIGSATPIPNIVFGCEGLRANEGNIYGATYSWSTATTPIAPEVFPQQAFDRLFDVTALRHDRSILDGVLEQSRWMQKRLDAFDRDKLDEYVTSVRDIERRIRHATGEIVVDTGWKPTLAAPNIPRPETGKPRSFSDHADLMLDLIVLAFQMDKTRVASFLFENDVTNNVTFEFLPGVDKLGLHALSHTGSAHTPMFTAVNRFHVEKFARMLGRMKAIDEGNGTLLDNSMILFGSTFGNGNGHNWRDVPIIVAGRGGGELRPGKSIVVEKEAEQYLCNLHLTMARKMGVKIDKWGNSRQPLEGLG